MLRINQWYKNCLIFFGLIFDRKFFSFRFDILAILGFFMVCLVSSSNYIINDVLDRSDDKLNNIKENFISTKRSLNIAVSIAIALIIVAVFISWFISIMFFICIVLISVFGQIYNFIARKKIVADILVLICIYILRTYSGYYLVDSAPNGLLILPLIILIMYLIFIKKRSILLALGEEKAIAFRKSYKFYSLKRTQLSIKILAVILAVFYFIYLLLNEKFNPWLLYSTYPFAVFLIYSFSSITAKQPEMGIFLWKLFKIHRILLASIIITIIYAIAIL